MEFTDEKPAVMLTAADARKLCSRNVDKSNVNYNLTLNRLMKIIQSAAKSGQDYIDFEAPSFVLDGSLADPIVLARQLKKKLQQMGYKVGRSESHLKISWTEN